MCCSVQIAALNNKTKLQNARKDEKRVVEKYTLSANQGDARAQFNLGCMYYNGHGGYSKNSYIVSNTSVDQSLAEASKWFKKAASQGNKAAIKFLKELDTYDGRSFFKPQPILLPPSEGGRMYQALEKFRR